MNPNVQAPHEDATMGGYQHGGPVGGAPNPITPFGGGQPMPPGAPPTPFGGQAQALAGDFDTSNVIDMPGAARTPPQPAMPLDRALQIARDAFRESTNYFDVNIRSEIERDLRQWQSVHSATSRYSSDANKGRSKLFRPLTRAAIQRDEAKAAQAFFSAEDVVAIDPDDQDDKLQVAAAKFFKALLQKRLTRPSTARDRQGVDWYLTCMGAYQDARVTGVAIGKGEWLIDKRRKIDRPSIRIVPIENLRFDPACDWRRPAQTSPYIIELIPMYLRDVMERINDGRWLPVEEAKVRSFCKRVHDTVRQQREGNRTDSTQQAYAVTEFTTVWVHENVVDIDGADWHYYTLGTELLLSAPVPVEQKYAHGRPWVIGFGTIEAHKVYPGGSPRLTRHLQAEVNDLANARIDNVRFVLDKRYFVRRNQQVDLASLVRNMPGSGTLMNDVEKDVKVVDTPDVTASSYQEHDRLAVEFDSLAGNFSQASVQSNRNLNETVGGMKLLDANANLIGNYPLVTFKETWVEPVLHMLLELERAYEADPSMLQSAQLQAGLTDEDAQLLVQEAVGQGIPVEEAGWILFDQPLAASVNVGINTTSSTEKINALFTALSALREIADSGSLEQRGMDFAELCKEVFGLLGYRDGSRFFQYGVEDPRVAALMGQVQQLQQALAAKHPPEIIAGMAKKLNAEALGEMMGAFYSAMQAGQVVASVPSIAPVADALMADGGFVPQGGVAPGIEAPAAPDPALTQGDVMDPRTGVSFMPGRPNTSPAGPAPSGPPTAGQGQQAGIETPAADGVRPGAPDAP